MVVEVVYVFIIPVWIILIVLMFAMELWELLGGFINGIICAFILLMMAFTIIQIVVGVIDLFWGDKDHLIFEGDYWKGLLGGLVVSLVGGSLMYDTYFRPYIVRETGYEKIVSEPEKEQKALVIR